MVSGQHTTQIINFVGRNSMGPVGNQVVSMLGGIATKANVASLGVAAVGVGGVMAFNSMIDKATTFEVKSREVNTLLRLGQAGFNRMQRDMIKITDTYGVMTNSAIDSYYNAVSAGVEFNKLNELMAAGIELSIATLSTLPTTVDALTSAVNAYGKEAYSATEWTDMFMKSIELGKVRMDSLNASIQNFIPAAAVLGINPEEALGLFTGLTRRGYSPSEAGTIVQGTITQALQPPLRTRRLLQRHGVDPLTAEEINEKGIAQALADFKTRIEATGLPLRTMIQRLEAWKGITISAQDIDAIDGFAETIGNAEGATRRAYEEVEDTTRRKTARLAGNWESLQVEIGTVMKPAKNAVIDFTAAAIRGAREILGILSDPGDETNPNINERKSYKAVADLIEATEAQRDIHEWREEGGRPKEGSAEWVRRHQTQIPESERRELFYDWREGQYSPIIQEARKRQENLLKEAKDHRKELAKKENELARELASRVSTAEVVASQQDLWIATVKEAQVYTKPQAKTITDTIANLVGTVNGSISALATIQIMDAHIQTNIRGIQTTAAGTPERGLFAGTHKVISVPGKTPGSPDEEVIVDRGIGVTGRRLLNVQEEARLAAEEAKRAAEKAAEDALAAAKNAAREAEEQRQEMIETLRTLPERMADKLKTAQDAVTEHLNISQDAMNEANLDQIAKLLGVTPQQALDMQDHPLVKNWLGRHFAGSEFGRLVAKIGDSWWKWNEQTNSLEAVRGPALARQKQLNETIRTNTLLALLIRATTAQTKLGDADQKILYDAGYTDLLTAAGYDLAELDEDRDNEIFNSRRIRELIQGS